jgi:hypothetical protein
VRSIQHQRLPAAQLVPEDPRQPVIPLLGQPRRDLHRFTFDLVEIDIEVLGLQHAKVERPVLDLVGAEILRGADAREHRHEHGSHARSNGAALESADRTHGVRR